MRTAVMGAGSLGTIAGALLSKAGLDVVLVDANEEHVNALNADGASVVGCMELVTPVRAITPDRMDGVYDLVIYLAKATYDEVALPQARERMDENSMLITLQNGVPEERVASFIGRERTLGGAVGWGATWKGPGVSELTTEPDKMTYDIGELDGSVTERLGRLKEVLDNAGKAEITRNLVGVRWSKLLVNVAMSGLSTVLGCNYGEITDDERASDAALCIMLETIRTAQGLGITMEPLQGLNPEVMLDITKESVENARNVLKMIYTPHRGIVGSMLQDIKKGLPSEVGALNGYLSEKSSEVSVPTPVNDQVTEMIIRIQAGGMDYGFSNLEKIELPDLAIYFPEG
jgi:2-dehydropantoate 2-reductase